MNLDPRIATFQKIVMGSGALVRRKRRILNGAHAVLEVIENKPFRCIFVGGMPACLNGGKVPLVRHDSLTFTFISCYS